MPDLGDSPVPNLPSIRPAKPKFSRPGISLSRPIKKEWRDVNPHEVQLGDIIVDFGQIAHILERNDEFAIGIRFENIMGDRKVFNVGKTIRAFVRVKSD